MNRIRFGIIILIALCIWIAWPKGDAVPPRPLLIRAALKQVDDPIVILGDSIVERASLPRTICGRAVVNAGISGSTTSSNLPAMLEKALAGKTAAAIVVSLGLNDAAGSLRAESYKAKYQAILAELAPLTRRLAVLAVSTVESASPEKSAPINAAVAQYNSLLPDLARDQGVGFIDLPAMPTPHTVDGIHLNASGYQVWTTALLAGIEAAQCKDK